MTDASAPINIATNSRNSTSPHQKLSNLTNALHSEIRQEKRPPSTINSAFSRRRSSGTGWGRRGSDSSSMMGISYGRGDPQAGLMNPLNEERPRCGSTVESLAGSLSGSLGSMSLGGISAGNWVLNETMTGTSPWGYRSPSKHSSSYCAKMEAEILKDYSCCGQIHPDMHALLFHYETAHKNFESTVKPFDPPRRSVLVGQQPDSRAAIAVSTATSVQLQAKKAQEQTQPSGGPRAQTPQSCALTTASNATQQYSYDGLEKAHLERVPSTHDMDPVESMELDEEPLIPPSTINGRNIPGSQFRPSTTGRTPAPLDLGLQIPLHTNQMHQSSRQSQPTTPTTAIRSGHASKKTPASCVNTPTLSANPFQSQQSRTYTPASSNPGTPGELDPDLDKNFGDASVNTYFEALNSRNDDDSLPVDLCVDNPGQMIWNEEGKLYPIYSGPQIPTISNRPDPRLGTDQYGPDSERAKNIRAAQKAVGLPDTMGMSGQEPKPYCCPVRGCEKAYKNQNGLKYHKAAGHKSQKLQDNGDGTFSIINGDTGLPYPGTQGVAKDRPYKCDVCGTRYKNLNGLKYHRGHNAACELGYADATGVNVAGAGRPYMI